MGRTGGCLFFYHRVLVMFQVVAILIGILLAEKIGSGTLFPGDVRDKTMITVSSSIQYR
jgi:hypothetical protein